MAISQRQFAAEVIDGSENVAKFDDIGCMLRYLASSEHKQAEIFVVDYETRQWLDARTALYLRGSKVATPMSGGILAFGQRTRAEAAAHDFGGAVLPFEQMTKP